MNKEKLEKIFRTGGVSPIDRVSLGKQDVFIGDGFSLMPHNAYRKFGVEPDEFPGGMYVTWWWLGKDEKLDVGRPLFFDAKHNPEYSREDRQQARVNAAVKEAKQFIEMRANAS